jgi:hypothetical protein
LRSAQLLRNAVLTGINRLLSVRNIVLQGVPVDGSDSWLLNSRAIRSQAFHTGDFESLISCVFEIHSSTAELERPILKANQGFARTACKTLASTKPESNSFGPTPAPQNFLSRKYDGNGVSELEITRLIASFESAKNNWLGFFVGRKSKIFELWHSCGTLGF